MNHRYDRMIETMRMTRIYTQTKPTRNKAGTNSTSSPSRSKEPGEPSENYYKVRGRHLGREFTSLEEMVDVSPTRSGSEDEFSQVAQNTSFRNFSSPQQPLPKWLAQTFATLPREHPLRFLIPQGHCDIGSCDSCFSSDSTVVETALSSPGIDQQLFAFGINDTSTSPTVVPSNLLSQGLNISDPNLVLSGRCVAAESHSSSNLSIAEAIPRVGAIYSSPPSSTKPFSTPGPASTISRPLTPPRLAFRTSDKNMFYPSHLSHKSPILGQELAAFVPDLLPRDIFIMDDETSFYQEARSDRSLDTCAYTDDIFSGSYASSGPCHAQHPIFSDLPVEDRLNSDLPSGPYYLDVEELDFQWSVFDCGGSGQNSLPRNAPPDTEPYTIGEEVLSQEDGGTYEEYLVNNSQSSDESNRFRFQAALDVTGSDPPGNTQIDKCRKPFAPITGIYLSPLKGPISSTLEAENPGIGLDGRSYSRDSIESWSD